MNARPDYSAPGSYDDRCAEAATRQGLDAPSQYLTNAGIAHRIDQTGGFTMVLVVPAPNGDEIWVTDDGERDYIDVNDEDGTPIYLVGHYTDEDLREHQGTYDSHDVSLFDLVGHVHAFLADRQGWPAPDPTDAKVYRDDATGFWPPREYVAMDPSGRYGVVVATLAEALHWYSRES